MINTGMCLSIWISPYQYEYLPIDRDDRTSLSPTSSDYYLPVRKGPLFKGPFLTETSIPSTDGIDLVTDGIDLDRHPPETVSIETLFCYTALSGKGTFVTDEETETMEQIRIDWDGGEWKPSIQNYQSPPPIH